MALWITTGPLEQANDTKELNQVQLPLLARAKLVDNSVDDSGMVGWIEGLGLPASLFTVDAVSVRHHGLTSSPRVFPHKPLTRWKPEQDISCGCCPAKSLSGEWPERWSASNGGAKIRPADKHCQKFGFRNLQS